MGPTNAFQVVAEKYIENQKEKYVDNFALFGIDGVYQNVFDIAKQDLNAYKKLTNDFTVALLNHSQSAMKDSNFQLHSKIQSLTNAFFTVKGQVEKNLNIQPFNLLPSFKTTNKKSSFKALSVEQKKEKTYLSVDFDKKSKSALSELVKAVGKKKNGKSGHVHQLAQVKATGHYETKSPKRQEALLKIAVKHGIIKADQAKALKADLKQLAAK